MTKRHLMTLRVLMMLADGLSAFLVFVVVSYLRFEEVDPTAVWWVGVDIPVAATLFAFIWVGVLWSIGLYRLRVRWRLLTEARDIARATLLVVALTLSILFILHQDDVSRVFLAILLVTQPGVTLAGRALLRFWFDALRRLGRNTTYMLVVGTGSLAQAFADSVEAHTALGVRVVGHLTVPVQRRRSMDAHEAESPVEDAARGVSRPILGSIEQMGDVFRLRIIDEVAVCLPPASAGYLEPIIARAADEGKTVRVPSDPAAEVLAFAVSEEFEGYHVRSVIHDSQRDAELVVKRLTDIVGAASALLVLSPLLVMTAIVVGLKEGLPILFRQTRIGRHGRTFTIYKFRTMVSDAEDRYGEVAGKSDTGGPAFKMHDDPRVTKLGRFLRQTSIDELPQLMNVLRGEMSLVGPRPAPPREVQSYDVWHRRRLSMRPGITGLWQVESRMDHHFDERAELDLRYIDHWTLWMDVRILLRTIPAVLQARGR
jgi:exopolysaccharide biosynthesis polyprenyl glycosylphosphotransferase